MGAARRIGIALAAVAACAGCVSSRPQIDAALQARPAPAGSPAAAYAISCPDIVDVAVAGRPDLSGRFVVEADGTLRGGALDRVRLDGLTPALAAERVAAEAGLQRQRVSVHVVECRSRQVFLLGPVAGSERAVAYQGPETVVDLLRRCGGLGPAADLADVHVVRSHVADGRRPEVFPVDLEAILVRGDPATNVRVEPYDQVYVGESRWAFVARHLPFTGAAKQGVRGQ